MLIAAVGLFLAVDAIGMTLVGPEPADDPGTRAATSTRPDALVHVLLALAAVLVTGQLLGLLCRRIGQPPVIGAVIGGILLGPSHLGQGWPTAGAFFAAGIGRSLSQRGRPAGCHPVHVPGRLVIGRELTAVPNTNLKG
jgi:hypothetical protein